MSSRLGSRFEDFYLLNKFFKLQLIFINFHAVLLQWMGKVKGVKGGRRKGGERNQGCGRKGKEEKQDQIIPLCIFPQSFICCLYFYVFLHHRCPVHVWEEELEKKGALVYFFICQNCLSTKLNSGGYPLPSSPTSLLVFLSIEVTQP